MHLLEAFNPMPDPFNLNFRLFTAKLLGARIFRYFTAFFDPYHFPRKIWQIEVADSLTDSNTDQYFIENSLRSFNRLQSFQTESIHFNDDDFQSLMLINSYYMHQHVKHLNA